MCAITIIGKYLKNGRKQSAKYGIRQIKGQGSLYMYQRLYLKDDCNEFQN